MTYFLEARCAEALDPLAVIRKSPEGMMVPPLPRE
jgi:hypothetical protein